ncbi:MFS quinate transporter [Purpureocillium lavendulum]|uniref:MFS quinate transporter n=1 Tax=Purpureocillium lavendulum TaxID=1247861 RepID=A0AB34FPA5_9HYPO|nr:MFS quinate transporter [Purpureocillium lavendulum]
MRVDHTSPDNALSNGMPTAERSACHRDPTPTDSALALEEAHSPSGSKPCRVKLKRDRAILSCVRCRKHKVRCDRRIPCGRCIKTRREAQCVYSEPAHAPPKPVVWDGDAALNTIATRFVDATWDAQNRNGTHWNNLLQELKAYLPRDHGARTDFNIHRESLPQPLTMSINYPFSNDASSPEAVQRIVNQLPPRALQDIFISQYADTVERAYHLLDEKAWRQELEQFWLNDNSMPADWLALHLMILSLGCQAHNFVAQATGEGEAYDSLPTRFMHSAEVCLKRTPYMLRPTLANIRTLCLIVISKQIYAMSCHESDTCWPLTGLIKRLCMRIGLHVPIQVDPDSLGARNDNMARRKLWAVVVFLDMRQSLVCGMPVLLRPQDLACFREPSQRGNALSREEHRHSEQDTTSNSWLENIFSTSGDLLLQALDAANSADGPVTYDQVAELDAALRQQLKCSGMGLATANLGTEGCPGPIDLEACTVHLFFRLVLMALHSRFALSSSATADHPISCVSSLESALATLSHQRTLCEDVGWERQRRGRGRGRQSAWFAGLLKHEFFTAAMTVCSQLVRTGGDGMALGLPSSCSCEGRPREIVLEALQSCRDVWSRDKDASICNANAFAVVDNLVCILRDSQQSA